MTKRNPYSKIPWEKRCGCCSTCPKCKGSKPCTCKQCHAKHEAGE